MTVRISVLSLAFAAAMLGPVGTATAQEISSPYRFVDTSQSIRAWGGYILTDPGELGLGPQSGPIGGVRYAIRISGPFTIEGGLGFFPSSRTVLDVDTTATQATGELVTEKLGEVDLSILLADVALRFNVTGPRTFHGLLPYLLFGGGVAIDLSGEQPLDDELTARTAEYSFGTTFAGQVGGGVEWFVTRHVTIGLDARDVLWQITTPPAFRTSGSGVPDEEWVQNFLFSAVVTYRF